MSRALTLSASIVGVLRRSPAASSPSTLPRSTVMPPPNAISDSSATRNDEPPSNPSCAQAPLNVRMRSSSNSAAPSASLVQSALLPRNSSTRPPCPCTSAARTCAEEIPASPPERHDEKRAKNTIAPRARTNLLYTVDIRCAEVQIKVDGQWSQRQAGRQANQIHPRHRRRRLVAGQGAGVGVDRRAAREP